MIHSFAQSLQKRRGDRADAVGSVSARSEKGEKVKADASQSTLTNGNAIVCHVFQENLLQLGLIIRQYEFARRGLESNEESDGSAVNHFPPERRVRLKQMIL